MTPAAPATLIFNPNAGQKLGLSTNTSGPDDVQAALRDAGVAFDPRPTEYAGHATELARAAVAEGRRLVIAAGGDGTVGEVAQALAGTDAVLGVMPLGSVMNVARTLCIPRDLPAAARLIAHGEVLAMDLGKVGTRYFLEAAGVGLAAGLFGYFEQLDARGLRLRTLQGLVRFVRGLGTPRLLIEADGRRRQVRAPMVTIANAPFVGAAYALAPAARIDDGLLDVVIFRGLGVVRILAHLVAVFGGRRLPPPPGTLTLRARDVRVSLLSRYRRPLPVHADGAAIGTTPTRFEVAPGALRVLVGQPDADAPCAWRPTTGG
ncbi:MAG TPA: diacylglycerol kinase family protein [Chloroflexota bacterium]|nr:diacylglycerol kinase family protein [Chloroflexota bacterium]